MTNMKKIFMENQEVDKNQKLDESPACVYVNTVGQALPLTLSYNLGLKCDSLKTVCEFLLIEMKPDVRNGNCIKRYIRWSVFQIKNFL